MATKDERSFFFDLNLHPGHPTRGMRKCPESGNAGTRQHQFSITEVETMRTRITLACTECKQRNYNTTKDKKTHPDRMEVSKYCRFCKKHTTHKETK